MKILLNVGFNSRNFHNKNTVSSANSIYFYHFYIKILEEKKKINFF